MTWDPRAFLAGGGGFQPGGFQPGGIMGGPGQGGQMPAPPAAGGGAPPPGTGTAPLPWTHGAGGGMPSLQDFWSRIQNAGGQIHDGLRDARAGFRDRLMNRFSQFPGMHGMHGGQGHFQMPPGFAAHMPWGQGAAPGGGGPGAMGGTVPNNIAAGEPSPSSPPGWAGSSQVDAYNKMAARNNETSGQKARGNYVPQDPGAAAETKRKAEEIGKKAKGY